MSRSAKSHKMASRQDQLTATASKSSHAAAPSRVHRSQYIHGDCLDTATALLDSKDIQPNKCHWKYWRTDIVSWSLSNTIQPGYWKYSSMSCFPVKIQFCLILCERQKIQCRQMDSFLRLNHFEKGLTMFGRCEGVSNYWNDFPVENYKDGGRGCIYIELFEAVRHLVGYSISIMHYATTQKYVIVSLTSH